MNRLAKTFLALGLLFAAPFARATGDQVTMETKWNEKTVSITTFGVTSVTLDVGGFGGAGYAINGGTQVLNGVDGTVWGSTAPIVLNSTSTLPARNVVGSNYIAYSTSTFTLQIAQTLKTPPPLGAGSRNGNTTAYTVQNTPYPSANFFTVPVISTSAPINVPAGVLWTDAFRANTVNPIFYLSNLSKGASYYLTVDYLVPEIQ